MVAERLTDAQALDALQTLLSAEEWNSAADYLEEVAEIVRQTGRTIDEAPAPELDQFGPSPKAQAMGAAVGKMHADIVQDELMA